MWSGQHMKRIIASILFLSTVSLFAGANEDLRAGALAGNNNLVKTAIANRADVNSQDSKGNTPLMLAVGAGHLETARLIIAAKPNLQLKNKEGKTVLKIAEQLGKAEIVGLLRAAGAKP